MSETPRLRWFEKIPRCPCGKVAEGILRGDGNESYGHHCQRCADKRLLASEKARVAAKKSAPAILARSPA